MIRFFAKEDQNGEVARHYERSKEVGFNFFQFFEKFDDRH